MLFEDHRRSDAFAVLPRGGGGGGLEVKRFTVS